jgi:hypothetical protein
MVTLGSVPRSGYSRNGCSESGKSTDFFPLFVTFYEDNIVPFFPGPLNFLFGLTSIWATESKSETNHHKGPGHLTVRARLQSKE